MVNVRLCETVRLAFFFASPRHFDFVNCETETSKREEIKVHKNKQTSGTSTETFLPWQKIERTPRRFHEKMDTARPT